MTLSGATSPGKSGPESNGNVGVLHIPQISKAEFSASGCLTSLLGHVLGGGSYPCAEMQSVYSTNPANWAGKEKKNNNRWNISKVH